METAAPLPRVLVIDDEMGPRESLRILLKLECEVMCASSVNEGLRLFSEKTPDLVIMDIRMPDHSGIDGLREIRKLDPQVSVIMLTGYGTLETAQEALRLGANDYLKKPFDTGDIFRIVRQNIKRTRHEFTGPEVQAFHLQARGKTRESPGFRGSDLIPGLMGNIEMLQSYLFSHIGRHQGKAIALELCELDRQIL